MTLVEQIEAYLVDAPLDGRHSDAAGADAYELLRLVFDELEKLERLKVALANRTDPDWKVLADARNACTLSSQLLGTEK